MLDRKIAPEVFDAIDFEYVLPPINTTQLQNGLPLYWLNAGVKDVAEVDFVFPAGLWYEPKNAVANITAALLKNGTSGKTAQQIHEALEYYGANLKIHASNDFATITLYTLTKHLPELLPVVKEIITDAAFPEEELAIYRQNAIQRLMVNLRQCEFVSNQKIDAVLFGKDHPYGRYSEIETIETITRQDLVDFYKEHYALANVRIFLSGNVAAKEVALVDAIFGKEQIQPSIITNKEYPIVTDTVLKQHIINDENGVQGAIRIGSLFPNRHHPDYTPMVVLNTLFGGYFGSRLMSNIREEKGYTYGIYSSVHPFSYGGLLTIHTEVGRDVIEPAIAEIYKEMELLCNEPADEEELLLVKNYLLGNLLGDLDGPFSIMNRWRNYILNDFDETTFNKNIDVYKNVTAAELQSLANKYLKPELFHEVVVI